ncbi:glycosyltransferase [Phormidium sp. LEGE 05292]|uniref:glycosyltransferase family 4 protein n=1 Tax=[Phormidium] sp. LEGE 05292 TaxID=767427 RepID=UPI001881FE7B|nr:glycosyltransferase [Phormidium sp. LEGE 05292]MBE9228389.1 glycosyltransferase [Phormidium sp. LEGE 05292]
MKVLLSAYACEPGRGTELGVGWNTVREAARYHEVWVLTRPDDGREAIEAELARNPVPNLHFVYFTLPIWGSGWKWGQGAFQIHYYLWQIQAYFVARKLHREIGFDLLHHVTFVRYSTPSFIALLPIPFVWGPVGGGESAPVAFWKDFSLRGKVYELLRKFSHFTGECDPFTWITARRSAIARATTEETALRLRKLGAKNVQVYSQVGLLPEEIAELEKYPIHEQRSSIRFISIGRFLHWKGFYLGIKAFAKANLPDAEYWLLGDGPERGNLEKLIQELGITHQVKFWSELPRNKAFDLLGECDVLVHPSLHDSGGFVCLEAMAAGRPVICLDLGGPGVQVTEETGFKISATNDPEQSISDLAVAMVKLAKEPNLRVKMGKAGRQIVRDFYNWQAKGAELDQLYEKIVSQQN